MRWLLAIVVFLGFCAMAGLLAWTAVQHSADSGYFGGAVLVLVLGFVAAGIIGFGEEFTKLW